MHSIYRDNAPLLDDSFYEVDPDQLEFLRATTGIQDEAAIKQHVCTVQAKAYAVKHYPCIRRFEFVHLKISRLPAYQHLLSLGKEREGALFLDIGCCFGNDIRKTVIDGYPAQNIIASDIEPALWDLGYEVFKDTPETFPVKFIAGDAYDPDFIRPIAPIYSSSKVPSPRPDLTTLTTLTPLEGHISAIHASSIFHLFPEPKQTQLARILAGLLSPEPGSMLFGSHGGEPVKGFRVHEVAKGGVAMFCHSPDSWRELWDGEVFKKGSVRVEAGLISLGKQEVQRLGGGPDKEFFKMWWTVTRL